MQKCVRERAREPTLIEDLELGVVGIRSIGRNISIPVDTQCTERSPIDRDLCEFETKQGLNNSAVFTGETISFKRRDARFGGGITKRDASEAAQLRHPLPPPLSTTLYEHHRAATFQSH